jgi:hypothetical protein
LVTPALHVERVRKDSCIPIHPSRTYTPEKADDERGSRPSLGADWTTSSSAIRWLREAGHLGLKLA